MYLVGCDFYRIPFFVPVLLYMSVLSQLQDLCLLLRLSLLYVLGCPLWYGSPCAQICPLTKRELHFVTPSHCQRAGRRPRLVECTSPKLRRHTTSPCVADLTRAPAPLRSGYTPPPELFRLSYASVICRHRS